MTKVEIVTALRSCISADLDCCKTCPAAQEDGCEDAIKGYAADLIEKLFDRCARYAEEIAVLQERQKWIPVTERLPEDRSDVLVVAYWHERWGVYMGWCAPERAEWSVHIGIGDRDDVAVTYWMPLPEPPKEDDRND